MKVQEKVIIVGDLHLFAARSQGMSYWDQLADAIKEQEVDRCIFMGDIFDFPWALEFDQKEGIVKAASMVEELVGLFPKVRFDYLYGNHDQSPSFESLLDQVCEEAENLSTHEVLFRLGDTVLLHGDAADLRQMDREKLVHRRRKRAGGTCHSQFQEKFYRLVVAIRGDEALSRIPFFSRIVHRRLIRFVEQEGLRGISRIIYGHTHRKLEEDLNRLRFINVGAPIGYREYSHLILFISLEGEGS